MAALGMSLCSHPSQAARQSLSMPAIPLSERAVLPGGAQHSGEKLAGRYTVEFIFCNCGPEFSGGHTPSATARLRTSRRCSRLA